MSEEQVVEVKEEKKTPVQPSYEDIANNVNGYEYQIKEIAIIPRIEVSKDGKLVKIIDDAQQVKYAGTMNPNYADAFLSDIVNEFKASFAQAYYRQMMKLQQQQKKE